MATPAANVVERPRAIRIDRRIGVRLPIAMAALLAIVVGLVGRLAYVEIRDEAVTSAHMRLGDVSHRLAEISARSTTALLEGSGKFGARTEIVDAFSGTGEEGVAKARAFLEPLVRGNAQLLVLELWNLDGTRLLAVPNDAVPEAASAGGEFPSWADPERPTLGALRNEGEELVLPVCVPVRGAGGVLGRLVQIRRVATSPESLQLLRDLIGADATILVRDGYGTWTDFVGIVEGPPPGTGEGPFEYRDGAGRRWLAAGEPMKGTDWSLRVRLPLDTVTARAEAFAARTEWIGAVIVLAGALGGWLLSRRVTGPLASLTRTASALAEGDLSRRVEVRSRDEIGAVGQAFNAMAEHVQSVNRELEARVAARTAELSAANDELKQFSYSVSHDLRAPLRAISGFSSALADDCRDGLTEQGRNYLDRIHAAVARMDVLIHDLLELARVAQHQMVRMQVDLSQAAREVVADLRAGSPEREADVRIADGLKTTGDPRLLRLVLQNLLGNAWKFTAKNGSARIELGRTEGPEPAFFVRDDGAGFDMTYAERLFGAFQRLHSGADFPGTGVGLHIVHRIVQRHGGTVRAEGAVGKGATFYFALPAA